jgi:molybdopterin converting factor small subunit
METIAVKIKFFGPVADMAGVAEMTAPINSEREAGMEDVKRLVKEKIGDQMLYTVLINGRSAYLNKDKVFSEKDEVIIVPIVLGG